MAPWRAQIPIVVMIAAFAAPFAATAAPQPPAPQAAAAGDPFQAVLTKAVRKVEWQRHATKAWQRAMIDTLLLGGDTLRTGGESKAELLYGDGSVTRVGSLTTLTLTGDKRREIRLDGGTIWLNIRKSGAGMRIITPGAVAAVTGTELMVAFDPVKRATEVTVFEGAVNVTGDVGDLVRVLAGTTSRVPMSAPAMAPVPLDDRKLQERNQIFRPLSLPEPQPSSEPNGAQPSAAPLGTQPSPGAAVVTPPVPSAAPPSAAPDVTSPTAVEPETPQASAAPATNAGAGAAGQPADGGKPVNPDLKGQSDKLMDPRVINGSPTTGRVKVIIE